MLKYIKQNKLSFIFFIIPVIILIFLVIVLLSTYKKIEIENYTKSQYAELEKLEKIILSFNKNNLNKLKSAERIFFDLINKSEPITNSINDSIYVDKIDKGISDKIKINKLMINNKDLYLNKDLTERITYITNTYLSIWQKIDGGYIRITSGRPGINNDEITIFLANNKQIVKKIESGKHFINREYINSDSELSVFVPLLINGKIEGFVQITILEFLPANISKVYNLQRTGFFLLNKNNSKLIANTQIANLINIEQINKIINTQNNKYNRFRYQNQIFFVSYFPEFQLYAGFACNENIVFENFYNFRKKVLITFSLVLIVLIISIFIYLYRKNKSDQLFLLRLIKVISGNKIQNIEDNVLMTKHNVIAEIDAYYSDISDKIHNLSTGKIDDIDWNNIKNDKIYNSLKELQNTLKRNYSEKEIQQDESRIKEIINKGNAEITGILQYITSIEDLSFNILKSITKFLEIQQGGIFVVNDSDPENPIIEMKAAYAYDKKRLSDKVINLNEGLIGRAYMERESIYMTEVPDKYTLIESGFGEEEPKYLLIVPLIFNNKVQAIIELAGINEIEKYKIKFIEEVGENIASTISNMKHSKQTEELLEQTTIQSKEIEEQRKTLEEKINTHRRQNRKLDKEILQLIEIIESIKSVTIMIEYDLKGTIMDVSRKTTELFQANKKEILSKHHKNMVLCADYDNEYKTFWEKLENNKPQIIKETFIFKGKEYKFIQNYVPIRNVRRKIFRILSIGTINN